MITNRPVCDNCPHYDEKRTVLNEGMTMLGLHDHTNPLSPMHAVARPAKMVYDTGACVFDIRRGHVEPDFRCSNHPWINRWASTIAYRCDDDQVSMADSWKAYLVELVELRKLLDGGTEEADDQDRR